MLVDTGAQANLVRTGLFPYHEWGPASRPIRLTTVTAGSMAGGTLSGKIHMNFLTRDQSSVEREAEFYEADIHCDAILGFPFLFKEGWLVDAKGQCLVERGPNQTLIELRGLKYEGADPVCPEGTESYIQECSANVSQVQVGSTAWDHRADFQILQPRFLRSYTFSEDADECAGKEFFGESLRPIGQVIEVGDKLQGDAIEKRRKDIHERYKDTAYRGAIWPEQPIRGPFGEARLLLRPGYRVRQCKPMRFGGERHRAITDLAKKWVKQNKFEPCGATEWLSAAFPVPKKVKGDWRGVIDYRGLNEETLADTYPLPNINDILERQGRRHLWSVIDLKDAFSQIPLHEDSRNLAATYTPIGVLRPKCMTQGLKNSPAVWQRMIEWVLGGLRHICDPYIDDLIIGTEMKEGMTREELIQQHDEEVRRVLTRLEEFKLVADWDKTSLFVETVEFCGHRLRHGIREPQPGKLLPLAKWPLPTNITSLRGFLGFCNYYNEYVKDFAQYAGPLQDKLKVGRELGKKGSKLPVTFTVEERRLFEELKRKLLSGLSLQAVNPDKPFVLRCDASKYAIGAALEQLPEGEGTPTTAEVLERKTKPVAFMSRKLTPGQAAKWGIHEKETYAIICALKKYAGWIGRQPVVVITDHSSLEKWTTEVFATPTGPTGRQARWHQLLGHFDVHVEYVPGKQNEVPDALSRYAYPAGLMDVSIHGSPEDDAAMRDIINRERAEERHCRCIWLRGDLPELFIDDPRGTNRQGSREEDPAAMVCQAESRPLSYTGAVSLQGLEARLQSLVSVPVCGTTVTEQPVTHVMTWDWSPYYEECPTFKDTYIKIRDEPGTWEWPPGVQHLEGKLYRQGIVCVPTGLSAYVIRAMHDSSGHLKGTRFRRYMNARYEWGHYFKAQREMRKAHRGCVACETFKADHLRREPIHGARVPRAVGVSVAIDVFKLPATKWENQTYDAVVLSTDRHSGWMVGYPTTLKGLTAEKVAKRMFHSGGWDVMGIPSEVTSDRGPQFASQWWSTMCGQMGVRHAMAQAYNHQANGSAERASQSLQRCLRELHSQKGLNWVEALPLALRTMMDMPRVNGLSPYRIVTGRDRPRGSIPYGVSRECVAATAFVERQRYVEKEVHVALMRVQQQRQKEVNAGRVPRQPFKPGDKVWVRAPTTPLGLAGDRDEFDVRWYGPCLVTQRQGEQTYEVQVGERATGGMHCKTFPRRFLRAYEDDALTGEALPLYYVQPKRRGLDEYDEHDPTSGIPEKILDDRWNAALSRREFLVKWKKCDSSQNSWEPLSSFLTDNLFRYLSKHPVQVDWAKEWRSQD